MMRDRLMSTSRHALIGAVLLFTSFPVSAHIVADPNTAVSGAWFRTSLRVTHGCDGEATTGITVTIPEGITMIRPQAKPGWTILIDKTKLAIPVEGPHGPIKEITKSITWSGNILPDAHFDEFGLAMKLPETTGAIAFPVHQKCISKSRNWSEVTTPDHHDHGTHQYNPAPVITLTPKQ